MKFDEAHWNRIHADEEPLNMPTNFTPDIEWRMNAPEEDEGVA
jgi:hypothetical protein